MFVKFLSRIIADLFRACLLVLLLARGQAKSTLRPANLMGYLYLKNLLFTKYATDGIRGQQKALNPLIIK
jgi:hypothetical protein